MSAESDSTTDDADEVDDRELIAGEDGERLSLAAQDQAVNRESVRE